MMKTVNFILLFMIAFSFNGNAQQKKYKLDLKKDLIIIGSGIGLSTLGSIFVKNIDPVTAADISNLNRSDIFGFDRSAISNNSIKARNASDIVLYSAISLPVLGYLIPKCRFEGLALGIMAVETILLTNGLTNISKGLTKRYRPFNYDPLVDLETKLGEGTRESFFSGHTSVSAAMSF